MQQNSITKIASKAISIVFHPVFVPTMIFGFLIFLSPNVFFGLPEKTKTSWLLIIAYISITFPLLTVFLLWRLKFIESMQMDGLKERYGPLIASMLFYFWIFWVFHKQFAAPFLIQTFLLGVFFTTVLTFLNSIFFKVSMHTSAWGSVFTFAIMAACMNMQNALFLIMASILIGGLVGSARLYLQAHNIRQIWIGYILGVLGQILSFLIIKIAFF